MEALSWSNSIPGPGSSDLLVPILILIWSPLRLFKEFCFAHFFLLSRSVRRGSHEWGGTEGLTAEAETYAESPEPAHGPSRLGTSDDEQC